MQNAPHSNLRDRLADRQRASLQPDQYRSEHPLGHALRHQQEEFEVIQDMKYTRKSVSRNGTADAGRQKIAEAPRAHFFSHGFPSLSHDDSPAQPRLSQENPH